MRFSQMVKPILSNENGVLLNHYLQPPYQNFFVSFGEAWFVDSIEKKKQLTAGILSIKTSANSGK